MHFLPKIYAALPILLLALHVHADDSGNWTRVNDDDAGVSYSSDVSKMGNTLYYKNDMHLANTIGAWCQFKFTGTGVRWIGAKNHDHGKADVFVDDKLEATVDANSPNWLTQQNLFEKTGLVNGRHEMRIVLKDASTQDFDAFEVLGPPPPPPPAKNLGDVSLPDQVPYLNPPTRYPLGNGVAMAVGGATGEWEQLAGPDYTCPNYIDTESLALEVDGVELPLHPEMRRARETGLYWGGITRGDLRIYLVDFAVRGQPWLSRLVLIDNMSATGSHDVRLRTTIHPRPETGMSDGFVQDAGGNRCGLFIQADPAVEVVYGGGGATNRSVVIAFGDTAGAAYVRGPDHIIESSLGHLAPNGSWNLALDHYFRRDKTSDIDALAAIRALKSVPALEQSITDGQKWFRSVAPEYQLSRITEPRARDLMEGALAVLKTNQSLDGGLIAHSTHYKEGYIRDAVVGLRGLTACGHFEESKLWLAWIDHVRAHLGHLPDASSCATELGDHEYDFDGGNTYAEEPALVLFTARDYYDGTKDLAPLKAVNATLQFCMDTQLQHADANDHRLEFNGDETEVCNPDSLSATTANHADIRGESWAYSSIGMCAASLDFYIKYVGLTGGDAAKYKNSITGTTVDLHAELEQLVKAMDRDFWRTDAPDFPGGIHEPFRLKADSAWPLQPIANLTLMPLYFAAPYRAGEKARDAAAVATWFDDKTGFLSRLPHADGGFEGHDLGYLLWALVETKNPAKDKVYHALVNGVTVDAWGTFDEDYDAQGQPNGHDLRSLESGTNLSALAKYWNLGL
jgi:hypothetical protein